MKGSTHLAGGLLAGVLVGADPVGVGLAGIAGLVPDWLQINIPGGSAITKGMTGHRGISHWLLAGLLVALGIGIIMGQGRAAYVLAGWVSHLALDMISGGVPVLGPISKRITLARIKTSSNLDSLTGGALLVLAVIRGFTVWT